MAGSSAARTLIVGMKSFLPALDGLIATELREKWVGIDDSFREQVLPPIITLPFSVAQQSDASYRPIAGGAKPLLYLT